MKVLAVDLSTTFLNTGITNETFQQSGKQEVGNDLSVCVMNILPKISSLPSLLAINLCKKDIDLSKSHVTSSWSFDQRVMFGSL